MSPAKEIINSTSWDTLFGYDTQHRLTTIQGPGNIATPGGTVGFEYTDLSAVARLNLGTTEMQLDYDPMGRLTTQTLYSPMQRKYIENTYYPDGKVHTYTQDNVVHSYTYDFSGRLIEWDNGSSSPVTYNYDKAGNLLNPKGKSLTFNQAIILATSTTVDVNVSRKENFNRRRNTPSIEREIEQAGIVLYG